jgi:hypothetical protein
MTATKPRIYTGEGSPIDNYFKPKSLNHGDEQQSVTNWGYFDKNNGQHSYILSILRTANIVVKNGRWGEIADMLGWFDRFLKSNKSPVKKPLKKMTPTEVSKIITALEGVAIWKNSI